MSKLSVQEEINQLNRRIAHLEHGAAKPQPSGSFWNKIHTFFALNDQFALSRIAGWAILTASILGLLNGYADQNTIIVLVLAGTVGLWLVIQASGYIDPSDSHRILAHEARATHATAANRVHPVQRVENRFFQSQTQIVALLAGLAIAIGLLTYLLTLIIPTIFWQSVLVLFIISVATVIALSVRISSFVRYVLIASCYVMVMFVPSHFFTLAYTAILTLSVYLFATERKDNGLKVAALAAGLYVTQAWLAPSSDTVVSNITESLRFLVGLVLAGYATIPFITSRRSFENRDTSRASLMVGAAGFLLTFLTGLYTTTSTNFDLVLLSVAVLYAGFSYFAWQRHDRLSYAKYFLTISLLAVLGFFYVSLDPSSATLFFFMSGVIVSTVGFTMPSYSARMMGLGLIGFAALNYFTVVMPQTVQFSGPIILRERVWIGLVIAAFLMALAYWYRMAALKGMEKLLVPFVVLSCYSAAFLMLFGIVYLDIPQGVWQTLLWLVLAKGTFWVAFKTRLSLLYVLSIGLFVPAFIKFVIIDTANMDVILRVVALIVITAAVVMAGICVPRYTKLQS